MTRATERLPDVHAVVFDDYLLDRLATGNGRSDTPVEGALRRWRDQLLLDLPPIPTDRELRAMTRGRRFHLRPDDGGRRAGRSWHAVTGIAASIVLLLGGTTAIGARAAHPGDLLWPVTQVLWGDRADSVLAQQSATRALVDARSALAIGDLAAARMALARAAAAVPMIALNDGRNEVAADLESLTATMRQTVAAPPEKPSEAAGPTDDDVPDGPAAPSAHAAPDDDGAGRAAGGANGNANNGNADDGNDVAGSSATAPASRAAAPGGQADRSTATGDHDRIPAHRSSAGAAAPAPHRPPAAQTTAPPSSRQSTVPTSQSGSQHTSRPADSDHQQAGPVGPSSDAPTDQPDPTSAATSPSTSASESAGGSSVTDTTSVAASDDGKSASDAASSVPSAPSSSLSASSPAQTAMVPSVDDPGSGAGAGEQPLLAPAIGSEIALTSPTGAALSVSTEPAEPGSGEAVTPTVVVTSSGTVAV
ncbi:hypothetical protein [Nakamurella lactea]|uniref:hypothetical protein n=1 Tax=Nakamurella lactea TaxID=459515 RepID=UPI0003F999D7|nr:hypothetical protein [Nakamurella lactea]